MKKRHLELKDREKLERLYAKGRRVEEIAAELKVHRSTIYNELRRGDTGEMDENGRVKYSALLAQRTTLDNYRQRRKGPANRTGRRAELLRRIADAARRERLLVRVQEAVGGVLGLVGFLLLMCAGGEVEIPAIL